MSATVSYTHLGDIFIALKGENFDGNRYAAAALEQGAALAIIDNADYLSPGCELVADSLLFLQQLAHYHRQQLHIPILGITGTNGKTTTKELCHAVLSKKFKTFATQGLSLIHIYYPFRGSMSGYHPFFRPFLPSVILHRFR